MMMVDDDESLWQCYIEVVNRIHGALKAGGLSTEFDHEIHYLYHMYRKIGLDRG